MKVDVKNSIMVKPAEPTWTGFIPLSDLDLVGTLDHVSTVHFYTQFSPDAATVFQTLKSSLSKALVYFYPLAGRLRLVAGRRGRYQIECNAAGALLTEAEFSAALNDVSDDDLRALVPAVDITTTPLEEYPLLVVQLTRFGNNGVSVGLAISHAVVDGTAAANFMRQWARIARGEPIEETPFVDRTLLVNLGNGPPPSTPVEFDEKLEAAGGSTAAPTPACSRATFKLTELQVKSLKGKANEDRHSDDSEFSRFESITAHIWRSACKAWLHPPDHYTRLGISVDLRRRLDLPKAYLGNAVLDVVTCCRSGDLVSNPLSYAAGKLRETINKVTVEYLNSTCAFLKTVEDLSCYQHDGRLLVTSWLTLPWEGMDFGWGTKACMVPVEYGQEGECLIKDGEERSVVVIVCLREDHIQPFTNFFLQQI